jgi:hypothetical protein
LAGTLLFDEKIRQSSVLFWFGLRNDGILYLQAAIPRTIADPIWLDGTFNGSSPFFQHILFTGSKFSADLI